MLDKQFQNVSLTSTRNPVTSQDAAIASTERKDETTAILSDDWQRWIATQKLLNVPDGEIVHSLLQKGIDIRIALDAIQQVVAHPYFQASSHLSDQLQAVENQLASQTENIKYLEGQLNIYRTLEDLSPKFQRVERRSRLSKEEFLNNYYATNTPVIMTDLLRNWKACSLWNPEYLKEKYGHLSVKVQFNRNSNPLYEIEKDKHQKTMLLREYADLVVNGGKTNNYYMVPFNGNFEVNEEMRKLLEDVEMFPEYLDPSTAMGKIAFWFGPAGTITPLHYDCINSLLCQMYGRKQVKLISPNQRHLVYNYCNFHSRVDFDNPDYEKYPRFKDVNIIDIILEPGEVMFLPVGWWHYVTSLDITISLSFMNFLYPNEYAF